MTEKEFYEDSWNQMQYAREYVQNKIEDYQLEVQQKTGENPIEYCKSRIKSPDSMIQKLQKNNLPINKEAALTTLTDAVGIRIICGFVDGVYQIAKWIEANQRWKIIKTKDYILHPKPNGYRSYHIILQLMEGTALGMYVEIQIRTIAIDCWASLEHQMKYKKQVKNQKLIVSELKRCADEIASIDFSMQTLKDLINEQ